MDSKRPPSVPAELGHPGGGRADPGHLVGAAEARPGGGGIRGGEGRRQVEADLRQRLEPPGRQGRLRHVWLPRREELQRPSLQVSPGGGAWGRGLGQRKAELPHRHICVMLPLACQRQDGASCGRVERGALANHMMSRVPAVVTSRLWALFSGRSTFLYLAEGEAFSPSMLTVERPVKGRVLTQVSELHL